jgi:tetratricopeptide (TPR) repeat protein
VEAALDLLDRMLVEWPEPVELAAAHQQRASCYLRQGRVQEAIDSLVHALDQEREVPIHTRAAFDFVWLVASKCLPHYYEQALAVADDIRLLATPVDRFLVFGGCALILHDVGRKAEATACAREAVRAAEATDSGFRYHRARGLVDANYGTAISTLRRLSASCSPAGAPGRTPAMRTSLSIFRFQSSPWSTWRNVSPV